MLSIFPPWPNCHSGANAYSDIYKHNYIPKTGILYFKDIENIGIKNWEKLQLLTSEYLHCCLNYLLIIYLFPILSYPIIVIYKHCNL